MKTKYYTLLMVLCILFAITSCEKDDEVKITKVTLGAQANTSTDGFYAVEEDKTYSMTEAGADQANIDIFCFYELSETVSNYTCLASPGSGITGIFTGTNAPENWTTQNTTRFLQTALTTDEYDAVQENDALLYSLFLAAESTYKKAKNVQVGQVWTFHTADDYFGLIKITGVTAGEDGDVSFEMKSMYYETAK